MICNRCFSTIVLYRSQYARPYDSIFLGHVQSFSSKYNVSHRYRFTFIRLLVCTIDWFPYHLIFNVDQSVTGAAT